MDMMKKLNYPLQSYLKWEAHAPALARQLAHKDFPKVLSFDPLDTKNDFYIHNAHVKCGQTKLMCVASAGHHIRLDDTEHFGVLVPLSGQIRVKSKFSEASTGSDGLLIPGLGLRTTSLSKNYIGLVALLPRTHIERLKLQSESVHFTRQFESLKKIDTRSGAASSLINYLKFLVNEFDQNDTLVRLATAQRLASSLLLEYFSALLMEQDTLYLGPSNTEPAIAPWQFIQAKDYIEAHLTEPLTVAQVATAICTSVRSLQQAFKKHQNISPRAFIQELRLNLLHKSLCSATSPVSVTYMAYECGFVHLGRCALSYRQRFGETPRETLNRALRDCS